MHAFKLKDYFIRRVLIKGLSKVIDMAIYTEDVIAAHRSYLTIWTRKPHEITRFATWKR